MEARAAPCVSHAIGRGGALSARRAPTFSAAPPAGLLPRSRVPRVPSRRSASHASRVEGNGADSDVPVLSAAEVHARLAANAHPKALDTFAAFYSSW